MIIKAKSIKLSFFCSFILTVLFGLLILIFTSIFSFLGYGVFLFVYFFLGLCLFYFFRLTTEYKNKFLTTLSFLLNFILWTVEQVMFEQRFHYTSLYQDEYIMPFFVLAFGAFLLAINNVIIGLLINLFKPELKEKTRIEYILDRLNSKLI